MYVYCVSLIVRLVTGKGPRVISLQLQGNSRERSCRWSLFSRERQKRRSTTGLQQIKGQMLNGIKVSVYIDAGFLEREKKERRDTLMLIGLLKNTLLSPVSLLIVLICYENADNHGISIQIFTSY